MKIELIYLKNKLYCYSNNHDYVNKFLSQRNRNLFTVKNKKMNKEEFKIFDNSNYQIKLCEILLYDGINDLCIIGTHEEDFKLSIISEKIYDKIDNLNKYYQSKSILKNKVLKSINYLTNIIVDKNSQNQYFKIDTLNLFYYLFKNTFKNIDDYDIDEKFNLN